MKPIRITNKFGLPQSLVDAVSFSDRDTEGSDYSVTDLIQPPRIVALKNLYWDKLEEDVSERIWALLGSAGHELLKRYAKQVKGKIVEERAVVDVECGGKKFKISGQLDYATTDQEMELIDFKFTSVYSVLEGIKPEWVQQVNCYNWLAKQYGVIFKSLKINAIMRDWSTRKARLEADYPKTQVMVFNIPKWQDLEVESFIRERIRTHEAAKVTLPECTPEEMWEKPAKYACKKKGGKRAQRVFIHEDEAKEFAARQGLEIEYRPSERPRCESYCVCAPVCVVFQQWQLSNQ